MPRVVEKVTIFVTRRSDAGHDLLLFQHPSAGIQIPAGTVEAGEEPEAAAMRETTEETGLGDFAALRYLGSVDEMLPETRRIIAENTKVYAQPDPSSFDWAQLRRGLVVHLERQVPGFAHVTYEEWDRVADPRYISYQITGWVPEQTLAEIRRRHFYHLEYHAPTPERWVVETDNHHFELFWAPLQALPAIVEPQNTWLSWLDLPHRLPLIKRA